MKEDKKNHSFRKGLIAGALIMALLMGLSGCGVRFYTQFARGDKGQEEQVDAKIQELNKYIDQYYLFDYEEEDVENGIYKGLMAGLGDIYTGYYTPEEYASFMESSNGTYSGIGAMLSQDYNTGIITVVRAFEGSPAAEAGMQTDDILYKVEGEEVTGKDLSLVVADLKGEEGTEVTLSILRGTDEMELTMERRNIQVPTVEYRMETDQIGYISISEFDDVTQEQFMSALEALEGQGMKDLIIDLRNNGGGRPDLRRAGRAGV